MKEQHLSGATDAKCSKELSSSHQPISRRSLLAGAGVLGAVFVSGTSVTANAKEHHGGQVSAEVLAAADN